MIHLFAEDQGAEDQGAEDWGAKDPGDERSDWSQKSIFNLSIINILKCLID